MKDQYKNIAKWYDKIFEPMNSGLRNIGLKMAPVKQDMNVLDIGCGTGAHLRIYQKQKCNIYGIDLSQAMINVAKHKLGKEAHLSLCSATDMDFEDDKFDLILCSTVLHEMSQKVRMAVLKEAKRVLKKTGQILIIDFHPGPVIKIKGIISKIIITISEILTGREHFKNYRQYMKNGGMPNLINSVDFIIEDKKIVSGGSFGIFVVKV
jgi:ubiquinone/menaquinone biosynthesis C-methylase UbiE